MHSCLLFLPEIIIFLQHGHDRMIGFKIPKSVPVMVGLEVFAGFVIDLVDFDIILLYLFVQTGDESFKQFVFGFGRKYLRRKFCVFNAGHGIYIPVDVAARRGKRVDRFQLALQRGTELAVALSRYPA